MDDRDLLNKAVASLRKSLALHDTNQPQIVMVSVLADHLRLALIALADRLSEREDWVMVPREPTEKMVAAGVEAGVRAGYKGNPWCPATYAAMLSALPSPPGKLGR